MKQLNRMFRPRLLLVATALILAGLEGIAFAPTLPSLRVAIALVGWAVVYLASSRPASASRLRRLLDAAYDRWLKTPE